jgi:hypothetical protein
MKRLSVLLPVKIRLDTLIRSFLMATIASAIFVGVGHALTLYSNNGDANGGIV